MQILESKNEIQFIDLKAQQNLLRPAIDDAIKKVLNHGVYIFGPEVNELEKVLADFCGAKHAITCANGTDALILSLKVKDVKPGDAIFVPSFTFAASAEVVALVGATPIFVDVLSDTYNIDPQSLEKAIATAKKLKLKPTGIITVDIFGQPADYKVIEAIAKQHQLWIIQDAAQSYGGSYQNKMVGNIAEITTTSFFPAKPLGCYGDGGAIFTNDDDIATQLKSLRFHGSHPSCKYENIVIGMNSRLDTLQAAILIEKLKIFPQELKARQAVADYYTEALQEQVQTPRVLNNCQSAWAQYTLCLSKEQNRTELMTKLKEQGVPTVIYYQKPLHKQKAYEHYPTAGETNLPVSEILAERVLSLPMHPYLGTDDLDRVVDAVQMSLE
jgi:dTDP-4-amino-4,6-dideoxygalactose transaminase